MPVPRILVFGHSHIAALVAAYNQSEVGKDTLELVFYHCQQPGRENIVNINNTWQYNPECICELATMIKDVRPQGMISMLQGEQAILCGLMHPPERFEFYFPWETEEYDDSVEILPLDMVLEVCRQHHSLLPPFLDYLIALVEVPIFALSFPPPIYDAEFIMAHGREFLKDGQLATPRWRFRIWKAHAMALEVIYRERGIPFISAPPEVCEDNGYLLQPFWQDAIHANARYGQLLLAQLKALFVPKG
jgi:hypothetical protein